MELLLNKINESEHVHRCIGVIEGKYIIFKCPRCTYIRVLNTQNNRTFAKNDDDKNVLHTGTFAKNMDITKVVLCKN